MSNNAVQDSVFTWSAPIGSELARKERLTQLGLLGSGLAAMGWGAASAASDLGGDVRFLMVIGFMLLCLWAFGLMNSRQLRSTQIRIDRMGTLVVSDANGSSSIDLRTVSLLSIRRRNGRPQWKWSIEAVHRSGAWHTELAPLASYWNLDDETIAALDAELQRWLAWANGSASSAASASASALPAEAQGAATALTGPLAEPITVRGASTNSRSSFEWQPPEHPNKARNRRRLRIGVIGFALFVAVLAAISEAENGIAAVLFSMFVPVLILLIGFGIDRAYEFGRRFRIGVDHAGLSIRRSSKPPLVIPTDAVRSLQITLSSEATHDASIESSNWYLTVGRADGENVRIALPLSLGSSFVRNDAIALESELRRRLGVSS